VTREYIDILQRCLDINDDTRPTATDLLEDQWFKITDIKQRAYEEEKRQFKARILAKVPLIQKTNQTICILAQNPNEIAKKDEKQDKDEEKSDIQKLKKQIHIQNDAKPNFPYANNKDDLVISDYGLHSGLALVDREKDKHQQYLGPRENYPMTINLNNT
jgi:serine/threonine protein kinase